jgi:acetyl-CoA acyltransferase 1
MGIGPSIAIPMVLEKAGITKEDVDLFEASRASLSSHKLTTFLDQ